MYKEDDGSIVDRLARTAFQHFELYLMVMTAFVLGGLMGAVVGAGAGLAVAIWTTALGAMAIAVGVVAVDVLVVTPRRKRKPN